MLYFNAFTDPVLEEKVTTLVDQHDCDLQRQGLLANTSMVSLNQEYHAEFQGLKEKGWIEFELLDDRFPIYATDTKVRTVVVQAVDRNRRGIPDLGMKISKGPVVWATTTRDDGFSLDMAAIYAQAAQVSFGGGAPIVGNWRIELDDPTRGQNIDDLLVFFLYEYRYENEVCSAEPGLEPGSSLPMPAALPAPSSAAEQPPTSRALGAVSGRIAFRSERDQQDSEIYVMNADGSGQTRLTRMPGYDGRPSWSPDGRYIAFQSHRDGDGEVYVMNSDGTGLTNLTKHPAIDLFPAWSPDGRYIAFVSSRDSNYEIYVMNADGSEQTRLTYNTFSEWFPSWSPDGKRIVFDGDPNGNYTDDIYVMNADGTGRINLTSGERRDFKPSWSPDGQHIAFTSEYDEIWVMNIDGSGMTLLSEGDEAKWSPDGRHIVFISGRDGMWQVYVMNADGTGQTNVTKTMTELDAEPAWGP